MITAMTTVWTAIYGQCTAEHKVRVVGLSKTGAFFCSGALWAPAGRQLATSSAVIDRRYSGYSWQTLTGRVVWERNASSQISTSTRLPGHARPGWAPGNPRPLVDCCLSIDF